MMQQLNYKRYVCLGLSFIMLVCSMCMPEYVFGESRNRESIISDVRNPSNGVIKCDITVPAGERVDYSATLTPARSGKPVEIINGSLKNRTRKTLKRTVTIHVKHFSNKYKIAASYTKEIKGEDISYKDVDNADSALKKTVVTRKLAWDFSILGKGNREWKYRYKYVPYKKGYRKYIEVFDKKGKRIMNYVKQTVPLTKISKIIREMLAR